MNYNKRLYSTPLIVTAQWWRMVLIWGFIATIGITIIGCEKENENNDTDEYYVKYEVNSSTIYNGGKLDVTVNTPSNETTNITIDQKVLWETVRGPVQKDFNAILKVSATGATHDKLKLYTNIYVSKNNSPFAIKKSDGSDIPRDSVELNYIIDY